MKSFKERLERIEVEEPVHIPTLDGTGIAETIQVKVPAWRDPKDGEIYLDTEATAILDKVKARHMGLFTPDQIKALVTFWCAYGPCPSCAANDGATAPTAEEAFAKLSEAVEAEYAKREQQRKDLQWQEND